MANSVAPDQILLSVASDLGLHCLQKPIISVPIIRVIRVSKFQGPVVQSVVSLTSSLRVISFSFEQLGPVCLSWDTSFIALDT